MKPALLCALLVFSSAAQTLVDLRTQSKSVDFSSAASTKPFQSGTVLPANCTTGQMFFNTSAAPGANVFGCSATNTWILQSGSTTLAGDVTGPTGANSVVQIQGRSVSASAPQDGQTLVWSASAAQWQPQPSAGGGAGMTAQLGDFNAVRVNGTTLTIGGNCSAQTPCNVRFGAVTYSFTAGATINLTSGNGNAFIYIANTGALTVGHNLTLTCSGLCSAQSGVTSFPADSIPLFTWPASGGAWGSSGLDQRAAYSSKAVYAGDGLTSSEPSGMTMLSIDTTKVPLRVLVPASSTVACTAGSWAADQNYFYICVSQNLWTRVAASSF